MKDAKELNITVSKYVIGSDNFMGLSYTPTLSFHVKWRIWSRENALYQNDKYGPDWCDISSQEECIQIIIQLERMLEVSKNEKSLS